MAGFHECLLIELLLYVFAGSPLESPRTASPSQHSHFPFTSAAKRSVCPLDTQWYRKGQCPHLSLFLCPHNHPQDQPESNFPSENIDSGWLCGGRPIFALLGYFHPLCGMFTASVHGCQSVMECGFAWRMFRGSKAVDDLLYASLPLLS